MDAARRLAEALARELEREAPAGPEVERFARTALGDPDDAALAALLDDRDDPDAEALTELLLFPDAALKAALEPLLAELRLGEAMGPAVAEALAARRPEVRRLLPGGMPVVLRPGPQALLAVVRRLRPGHGAPDALAEALDAALEPEAALAARVALRHARCPFSRRNTEILSTLALSPRSRPGLRALLGFACALLAALPEGADVFAALAERHDMARRALAAQARHAEELARHNYETLALRGDRPPHADPVELTREMHLADRMALVLYGAPAAAPLASLLDGAEPASAIPDGLPDLPGPD